MVQQIETEIRANLKRYEIAIVFFLLEVGEKKPLNTTTLNTSTSVPVRRDQTFVGPIEAYDEVCSLPVPISQPLRPMLSNNLSVVETTDVSRLMKRVIFCFK